MKYNPLFSIRFLDSFQTALKPFNVRKVSDLKIYPNKRTVSFI